MKITRRKFIKNTGTLAFMAPVASSAIRGFNGKPRTAPLQVHIFSKHLQFLTPGEAGHMAAEMGFDGLDLTVRPKGHVLPENVKTDLPAAIRDIEGSGSTCRMITTRVADRNNPIDVEIIKTAAKQGVEFYRSDWFEFRDYSTLEESIEYYKEKVKGLSELNRKYNIIACYQNHSGTKVGASIWEVKQLLEKADPQYFGAQYDIRHAVAEGGKSWPNGVRLIKDQIKTIVLKDFKWGKVGGKWETINVPVGEGMVDFKRYFKLLKSFGLNPPVSLHLEYPLGGAEKGRYEIEVDKKIVFEAMKKDLATVHRIWKEV